MHEQNRPQPAGWKNPGRALIFIIVWFVLPFVILGKFSYIYSGDNLELLVTHLATFGKQGMNPGTWATHATTGMDVLSTGFAGFVNLALFGLFPGWLAYQVLVVVQTAGAIVGCYLICSRIFGLSKPASLFPGIIYGVALSGQLILSVFSLMPLLLFCFSNLLDKPGKIMSWIALLGTAFWISGTAYMSWLIPIPGPALIVWFLLIDTRRRLLDWFLILLVILAMMAFRVSDFISLLQNSPISHITLLRPLLEIQDILLTSSYIGSFLDCLCAGAFFLAWMMTPSPSARMRCLAVVLILGLFTEQLLLLLQLFLSEFLPFIQGFQVSRISYVFKSFLWLSSAFAVSVFLDKLRSADGARNFARFAMIIIVIGLGYLAVKQKYLQAFDWIVSGNYVHNLESPVIRALAVKATTTKWPERSDAFQIEPTYLHPYGLETAGGYQALYLRKYYDFWSTIVEPLGLSGNEKAILPEYDEWPFYRTTRLRLTSTTHVPERQLSDLYRINLLSMAGIRWILSRDILTDPGLELMSGPSTPWSSLSQKEKLLVNLKANFFGREHIYTFKNHNALPRFFSPTNFKIFKDDRALLFEMANSEASQLLHHLYINSENLPAAVNPAVALSPIEIELDLYSGDRIDLKVGAEESGLLVVMNAWSPFWTAKIDGMPAELFPANHAFLGVFIPKGARHVTFQYIPN